MERSMNPSRKKATFTILILLAVVFGGIQFIRPNITNPAVTEDFKAPENVKVIFKRACYDCHSNETNLRWYDQIAPVYWQVAQDVKEGREGLNFSTLQKLDPAIQKSKLWEAVNQVIAGAMPLKSYTLVHPESKLSKEDVATLKAYVWAMVVKNKPGDTVRNSDLNKQLKEQQAGPTAHTKLPTALNGIAYIPDYKNWQAISTTDRSDNGSLRVIFGNAIAVKAIKENNIRPWPDGTIFAKVGWDQLEDKDGNVTTGAFKQVEYMIKDHEKYASTKGWGFARFKTPKLMPYGKTIMFANECVNGHRPQKDEDFVFTLPIKH
jgi:cytochrome c551/c552